MWLRLQQLQLWYLTPFQPMTKNKNSELIKSFKKRLEHYEKRLNQHPNSLMYKGLVKNTKDYINELKEQNGNNHTAEKI